MSALSSIRRILRFGDPPKLPDKQDLTNTDKMYQYLKDNHYYFSRFVDEVNSFSARETAVFAKGFTLATNYQINQRGPLPIASITSASNFASGSRTIVVSAATGTESSVPWSLIIGDYLNIEPLTANQEFVRITAVSGTSITATFAKSHNGSGTPYSIFVPIMAPMADQWTTFISDLMVAGRIGT